MYSVPQIEKLLGEQFKKLPPMPKNASEGLAKAAPWLALVFSVLQILACFGLAAIISQANRIERLYDQTFNVTYKPIGISSIEEFFIYFGIGLLLLEAILLLFAVPKLMRREKGGWDHLFLVGLVNVLYAVTALFISDRAISSFLWNILLCGVSFYFLFQIKPYFVTKNHHKQSSSKR